jgi:outer membrane protein assembly factor BamB
MQLKLLICVLAFVSAGLARGAASTSAWPGFRGPNSSGTAADARPPVKIGPTNSVVWKVEVPWSPSSVCIWGDRLFLTTFAEDQLQTRCYRIEDGKLEWSRGVKPEKLEMYHRIESSPAASTPATDGRHVVSYFGSFGLVCYDLKGKELWRHALPMALSLGGYGTGTSPLLAGNLAVVSHDQDLDSSLVAVDVVSGEKVWETPRPETWGSFGTPILWQNDGVAEVVVPGALRIKGYALNSGKEDWVLNGTASYCCTSPIAAEGLLYYAAWCEGKADEALPTWEKFREKHDKNKDGVVSLDEFDGVSGEYYKGYDVNHDGKIDRDDWEKIEGALRKGENMIVAVKPGGRGDISRTHVAWKATKGLPYIASPVWYAGRVYMIKNGGMLTSLDAKTGQAYYTQERLGAEGYYYASPVAADGRIYLASQPGKITVVKAGGDKPEILHQVDFGEPIYASPALAGDRLYLRTRSKLYAFGEGEAAKPARP